MKLAYLEEPELEFGQGKHICPRAGISQFDVYDTKMEARRTRILVGAVGTSSDLSKLSTWLQRCHSGIPGELGSGKPTLHPAFCGLHADSGYRTEVFYHDEIYRRINNYEIKQLLDIERWDERVQNAVDLYYPEVKFLVQNRNVDVVVCVMDNKLYDAISKEALPPLEETLEDVDTDDVLEMNFRRALKAKTMHLGKPIQLIRAASLETNKSQQDDATKAWNFCTALYYKASNTVPWRLIADLNKPATCYVGISFYRSRDRKILNTSLAQVFNELGQGVILRGTPVDVDKDDRRPHLSAQQAHQLLQKALNEYQLALGNFPARLVLHKSSNYTAEEIAGFRQAANEQKIETVDFVTVLDSDIRLFRDGLYPPLRGLHVELDEKTHLLYTRGSVPYYATYQGAYIPQPLEIRVVESDESPELICKEILGLTKMNWNNTQFDGKYPITIGCARRVGQIMKYLGDGEHPQIRYAFYM